LTPFRALRETDRRRRDEERPLPAPNKELAINRKQPLDREKPHTSSNPSPSSGESRANLTSSIRPPGIATRGAPASEFKDKSATFHFHEDIANLPLEEQDKQIMDLLEFAATLKVPQTIDVQGNAIEADIDHGYAAAGAVLPELLWCRYEGDTGVASFDHVLGRDHKRQILN
jgi:hypothetical protein